MLSRGPHGGIRRDDIRQNDAPALLTNIKPGVKVLKLVSFIADDGPNKLGCLYLAITFQSSLTFAINTRSLSKKEASKRRSNWVGSGLTLKF